MSADTPIRVVGTAGHVDHGKSTLIRALTGIDPDRLREERERGMTIDLGFAWLTLPGGADVGIGPHNVAPPSMVSARTSPGRLDRKARQKIGHELRATYNDFREWELPKRIADLLERLSAAARGHHT